MLRIRAYQAEDQERLEACILELQNFERTLEPDRVEGAQMVVRNREELLAIVRQNRGQLFVAEVNAEVVGFVGVRLEHEEDEYLSTLVAMPTFPIWSCFLPIEDRDMGQRCFSKLRNGHANKA